MGYSTVPPPEKIVDCDRDSRLQKWSKWSPCAVAGGGDLTERSPHPAERTKPEALAGAVHVHVGAPRAETRTTVEATCVSAQLFQLTAEPEPDTPAFEE